MASGNFTNGVWRTIGGRRIFIQTGQSVSDAMKKSGKYKSSQQKYKEESQQKIAKGKEGLAKSYSDKELEQEIKSYKHELKEIEADYTGMPSEYRAMHAKEYNKKYAETEKRINELEAEQKFRKEAKRYGKDVKSKTMDQYIEDHNKKIEAKTDKEAFENYVNESAKIRSQQSDIEAASGSKVKRSFETDLYGNGKADRFELNDGRYIEHTKEAFGKKEDSWSINKVENGSITSKDFKSYEDMKSYLNNEKGGSKKILTEQKTDSAFSTPGKKYEMLEESTSAYGAKIYKVKDEQGNISWQKASKFESKNTGNQNFDSKLKRVEKDDNIMSITHAGSGDAEQYFVDAHNVGAAEKKLTKTFGDTATVKRFGENIVVTPNRSTSNNGTYRDAFNEYKRLHPNSKITLQRFVQMKRGK